VSYIGVIVEKIKEGEFDGMIRYGKIIAVK